MRNGDEKLYGAQECVLGKDPVTSTGLSTGLQELRRRLAEPGPWARRFRRLAEAIAGVSDMNCRECEELLDVYVDDALRCRNVQQVYPLVWQHLGVCTRCREAHDLLADTLDLERRGELPPIPNLSPVVCSDIKLHGSEAVSGLGGWRVGGRRKEVDNRRG